MEYIQIMDRLEIEYTKIENIKPYSKNARKHEKEDVTAIVNSIKEFGFNDPIAVWGDKNIIVEGHGRYEACKILDIEVVPIIHLDNLTDEQRRAYALAHNKTAELSSWIDDVLNDELSDIVDIDMSDFGFDLDFDDDDDDIDYEPEDLRDPSCQHNVFENQEVMQFPCINKYGIPELTVTQTIGDKMARFCDWKEIDNPEDYIAHFYYDDYKFMSAWRDPNKYVDRLEQFKAVISPNFSLYTDFPIALQILSCYRRNWCGAYWQMLGIDVIPNVCWGEKPSYEFCFDGIPKGGTVSVSTVGVKNDKEWNNELNSLFLEGYNEMMNRLEPTTILFYGDMIEGAEGNIIRIPSFYEERRKMLGKRPTEEE